MIFVGGGLSRWIALTLLGDDMQQDGTVKRLLPQIAQDRYQLIQAVTINGAEIVKAQGGKQIAIAEKFFHAIFGLNRQFAQRIG